MAKIVLVIGNGFDLHHKLNTKYSNFVNFTKEKIDDELISKICATNSFIKYFQGVVEITSGWIDCEEQISYVISFFEKMITMNSNQLEKHISHSVEKRIGNQFNKYVQSLSGGNYIFNNKWTVSMLEVDKTKFLNELRNELDEIIIVLNYYLSKCMNGLNNNLISEQINSIKPDYVVNFNYTDTCSKIYGIDSNNIFYIHGSINTSPNNMVFGITDNNIENLDFVYFKKYFQRIQKRTGKLEDYRFKSKYGTDAIVHFFGHSLGDTDKETILKIVSLSQKVIIYYLDQDDYEQKVINLIKIFGKEQAVKRIYENNIIFEKIIPFS